MDNSYSVALRYILQCLADTRARNYLATEERKAIIQDIHREYQMEMDKKAEIKKKKDLITPTKLAIPPKYRMKLALIIATTTRMQPPVAGIRTTLGAAQQALAPRVPTTSQGPQMPPPGILKSSKTLIKVLRKGRVFCLKLGTLDAIEAADTEWVLRPYMNTAKKRVFLSEPQ
uniref:Uncharacterized protein n=1 Tax=Romanomermis culicivorax TaxID=13658 RepID=A0A915J084_ROMCU